MAKIQIPKEEIKQIIKEEYFKALTKRKLENRLQQINEEMSKIVSEDTVEEDALVGVKAGKKTSTVCPDGQPGCEKASAEFIVKEEDEIEITDEMPSGEITTDKKPLEDELSDESIDTILAKLADAIKDEIETTVEEKIEGAPEAAETDMKEPIDVENPEGLDEKKVPCEECGVVKEQDGTSVAQEIAPKEAVPFDNGKAEIPKKDQLVSESYKKRAQILAGIQRNDFND